MSKPQGYRQSAADAVFYVLVFCLPWYRTLLLEGLGRMIFVLLLACLLLFLVVRSADVCRHLADCLRASWHWRFSLVCGREFRDFAFVFLGIPRTPSLAVLYQRPPPIFS